jgi:hypothetical protein
VYGRELKGSFPGRNGVNRTAFVQQEAHQSMEFGLFLLPNGNQQIKRRAEAFGERVLIIDSIFDQSLQVEPAGFGHALRIERAQRYYKNSGDDENKQTVNFIVFPCKRESKRKVLNIFRT